MNGSQQCLIARARANRVIERIDGLERVNRYYDGQSIARQMPEEIRLAIKEAGADALSVEVEWDGAYSLVPDDGDRVFVFRNDGEVRGFLNAVFGRVVELVGGTTVRLVPWNELLPSTTAHQETPSDDSYW